jgi:hypothetical protein
MKFLIALSVLVSASAFANPHNKIKCYEQVQQGGDAEVVYVLEEKGDYLYVKYPTELKGKLMMSQDGCLEQRINGTPGFDGRGLELCPTDGQQIRNLVPVEATVGYQQSETVYCEKSILPWFKPVLY